MTALAEKVEALSGPCRETDKLIARALGWTTEAPPHDIYRPLPSFWVAPDGSRHMAFPPHYTASVDAVLALIAEKLPGWYFEVSGPDHASSAAMLRRPGAVGASDDVCCWCAATPALALLAAFLRAMENDNG
jgi:hypothetical protein